MTTRWLGMRRTNARLSFMLCPRSWSCRPTSVHLSVQHLVQFVEEVASQDDVAESAVSPVVVELVLSQILFEFKVVSDGLLGLLRAERVGGGE